MNKTHRLIWNALTQSWVVVSEIAKSQGKRASGVLLLSAAISALPAMAQAAEPLPNQLPTGGNVVAGTATITQSAATMNVNQSTARAAVDWNTFNVGSAAQVNFNQPSSSSVTLNRVLDSNPSQIFGKINAPGQVFLTNPNGVHFAPGSSVNVGGLVATTHRITVDDFMAGKTTFERNGATGSVINAGELKAALGGYIALLAPQVRNEGVIIAQAGTVALASGEAITLNFGENGALAGLTATKSQIAALVENKNAVLAPGGLIILAAQAMNHLQGGVIKNSGRIEAAGLSQRGGRIILDASSAIENSGTISANASTGVDSGPAGSISLRAPEIVNTGEITAKGSADHPSGGTISINAGKFTQSAAGALSVTGPAQGGQLILKASTEIQLAGRLDANANVSTSTDTQPAISTDSEPSQGGEITVQAAQISVDSATLDTSGDKGGRITLDASRPAQNTPSAPLPAPQPGKLALTGNTTLNTRSRRGTGGSITLTGDDIALRDTTALDATGTTGGGVVLVGGDWQGSGDLHQATTVTMEAGATIDASAIDNGDGGKVVLWSDITNPNSITTAAGTIWAKGGVEGGDGGKIETSGATINIAGLGIFASGVNGKNGLWLIDPTYSDNSISSSDAVTYSNALTSGADVEVFANGDNLTLLSGITISKTSTGTSTFRLKATGFIKLESNAVIRTNGNGQLNVELWSDSDNNNDGAVMLDTGAQILSNGGYIKIGGGSSIDTDYADNGGGIDQGVLLRSGTVIDAAGGNISIRGSTDSGSSGWAIDQQGTVKTSGAGTITYVGMASSSAEYGVLIRNSGLVQAATGAISIAGTGGTAINSTGVMIEDNSTITSTSGSITVTGTYNNSGGNGIRTQYGTNTIGGASTIGAITLVTNKIDLAALTSINTSGTLDVRPLTNSGTMAIGTGTGTLSLPLTYFSTYFNTRISEITLGGSTTTGNVDVDSVSLNSDLQIWTSGTWAGAGTITTNGNKVTLNTSNTGWTVGQVIAGTGGQLVKEGTGTVTLTGANTYTGATTITGGILSISADANLGTAPGSATAGHLTFNGGTLATTATMTLNANRGIALDGNASMNVSNATVLTYNGIIAGSGRLTKANAGTLTLNGANTYTGGTTFSAGIVSIFGLGLTNRLGATPGSFDADHLIFNGGTLETNNSMTLEANRGVTMTGNGTIDVALGNLGIAGVITGAGNLTKTGSNTLTLSGANTYSGTTTISAGTLAASNDGALGTSAGGTTIDNNAALQVYGDITLADAISVAGTGVSSNGAIHSSSGSNTLTGLITQTAATEIQSAAGTLTLNPASGSAITGTYNLTFDGAGNITVSDPIATGTGTLTKNGTGTLTLSGANTYTGATTISAGTLKLGNAAALGTAAAGTSVTSGAALDLNGIDLSTAEALTLNGTGISSGGALVNSSATQATYSGLITLGSASSIVSNSGNIVLSNTGTITGATFGLTLGGSNTASSLASIIGNTTGGLTKSGAGTWTLSGANTYSGATTISAGTLKLGNAAALGTAAAGTSVTSGAALDLNGIDLSTAEALTLNGTGISSGGALVNSSATQVTYSGLITLGSASSIVSNSGNIVLSNTGTITGATFGLTLGGSNTASSLASIIGNTTGGLTKSGAGTWTLSGANTYSGATTISAGTLALNSTGTIASSSGVANNGAFSIAGNKTIDSMTGSGTTALGISTLTIGDASNTNATYSGIISGSGGKIEKAGAGTLTLGGVNTYTGPTIITAGTLALNSTGTIADSSAIQNSGNFTIAANKTIDSMTGSGTTALGSYTLTIGDATNTTATYSGIISGTGGLTKAGTGTLTLSGANTYSGATNISAGTLALNATGTIADSSGVANSGSFTIAGNKTIDSMTGSGNTALGSYTLTIGDATNTSAAYSGIISGTGGLTKAGAGTLTLSGANSYTGATTVSAGGLTTSGINKLADTTAVTVASGATFTLGGAEAVGSIAGLGNIVNGGFLLTAGLDDTSTTYSGEMSGAGGLTKSGGGTLTLGGANTYTGATTITIGTLALNSTGTIASSSGVANNSAFSIAGNKTIDSMTGSGTTALGISTLTIGDASNTNATYSGIISGTGGLTKSGAGTLTLGGNSAYSGVTTVSNGILNITHAKGLGATSSGTTVAIGASLQLTNALVGSEAVTLNGTGYGAAGALINSGTSSLGGLLSKRSINCVIPSAGELV